MSSVCNVISENQDTNIYDLPIEILRDILYQVDRFDAFVFFQDPLLRQRFLARCNFFVHGLLEQVYCDGIMIRGNKGISLGVDIYLHEVVRIYDKLDTCERKLLWICEFSKYFQNFAEKVQRLSLDSISIDILSVCIDNLAVYSDLDALKILTSKCMAYNPEYVEIIITKIFKHDIVKMAEYLIDTVGISTRDLLGDRKFIRHWKKSKKTLFFILNRGISLNEKEMVDILDESIDCEYTDLFQYFIKNHIQCDDTMTNILIFQNIFKHKKRKILLIACRCGLQNFVEQMLEHFAFNVDNIVDAMKECIYNINDKHFSIFKMLLKQYDSYAFDATIILFHMTLLIKLSCEQGNLRTLESLISLYNIDFSSSAKLTLTDCICLAIRNNHVNIVRFLIKCPESSECNLWGDTLHLACSCENKEIIKILLQHEDIVSLDYSSIVCTYAKKNKVEIVKILLSNDKIHDKIKITNFQKYPREIRPYIYKYKIDEAEHIKEMFIFGKESKKRHLDLPIL
jgi:hypothetical protein